MSDKIELQNFLPFRLNRVATLLSRRLSKVYSQRFGLDIPQWRVIATLGDRASCTAQTIVCLTYTHKSTISRAVAKLTAAGYIESVSSATDKRESVLRLSASGQALYDELAPLALAVEAEVIAELQAEQYSELKQSLDALESALGIAPTLRQPCGDANGRDES